MHKLILISYLLNLCQNYHCSFFRWFHAVRSWGRNLAVNVWFIHRLWFNETDCSDDLTALPEYVPLSSFKTRASHLEILRYKWIKSLYASVDFTFVSLWHKAWLDVCACKSGNKSGCFMFNDNALSYRIHFNSVLNLFFFFE